jgi:hypothetical protein
MNASRSFIVIGIILLLWNLMGMGAFIRQYTTDLDKLALTHPDTAHAFAQMPGWAWAVYAVAVAAGTLGAVLLLLKKALAVPLFAISVVAIVIQFGYTFGGTDLVATKGWSTVIFPAIIFLIGIAQFLYARALVAKGVLR